jgi:hypothetical protein
MKLHNLDNRFLLLLAKKWKETGVGGPYRTSLIYQGYSDFSDEYITSQLKKFDTAGLIKFTSDKHKISLTDKGFSQIKSLISIDRWNSRGI